MQLSSAQIRQLTVGALTIVENENGYSFTRFTPEQRESFRTTFEIWGERCDYTSGIRIDFHTDATAVEVTVGTAGKYEVLIDDLCAYFEELEYENIDRAAVESIAAFAAERSKLAPPRTGDEIKELLK